MARNKKERFAQLSSRSHLVEEGKELYTTIKGNWNEKMFLRQAPLVVELACGRGEYTVGLAQIYKEKNFVGVDIKGDRIWKGSTLACELGLTNVAFLRTYIQNISDFFAPGEIDEIWIVHPDPRPRKRDIKRRLTHPRFLNMYRQLLKPAGWVRLKTDSEMLFDYTLETLQSYNVQDLVFTRDLDQSELLAEHHGITTRYENLFKQAGAKIHYLRFRFA